MILGKALRVSKYLAVEGAGIGNIFLGLFGIH